MAPTDLPTFIKSLGIDEAAALFDVSPHTVKSWMYGERRPRPETARKLVERSKGRVTLQSIYGEAR